MGNTFYKIWTNFTAGELSPRLEGRFDVEAYQSGVAELLNFTVHPHGGADRRRGFKFIAQAKDNSRKSRLIPFVFNKDQSYVLEFGHQCMRVFKDQGQIYSGSAPYEIATPYTEDQLDEIKFAQSADVMYLAHPNVAPRKLSRTGHTSWTLSTVSFTAVSPTGAWAGENQPSCVGFFEQRSVWAATPDRPQTLWLSVSGDYENMTTGTQDDDAMVYTIAANEINPIQWLAGQNTLLLGALGGTWSMGARSGAEPVTPTNVKITRQTNQGASECQGKLIGNAVVYVHRQQRQVLEQTYSLESDSHSIRDLTLLSEHISISGIKEFGWQQYPDATLYALRRDGTLLTGTYYPAQRVLAWGKQVTQGKFESFCVIPGAARDEVWVVVNRTVNGLTRRFVELLSAWDPEADSISDAFFVDSGLTYSGAPTKTLTGLDHLAGSTVQILADGAVHPQKTVSTSGELTLNWAAEKIHVGLPYLSRLTTLRADLDQAPGQVQGALQKVVGVSLRLHASLGAKVGVDPDHLDEIPFRTTQDPMNRAIQPFSGDTEMRAVSGGWAKQVKLVVVQDLPTPLALLGIIAKLEANK